MLMAKKLKGIVSWHVYNEKEKRDVINYFEKIGRGEHPEPLQILTNLFKTHEEREEATFEIQKTVEESRLIIDNEEKKIILQVALEDVEALLRAFRLFLVDNKVAAKEIMRIKISKKEYSLLGFNQQYKQFQRLEEKKTRVKIEPIRGEYRFA